MYRFCFVYICIICKQVNEIKPSHVCIELLLLITRFPYIGSFHSERIGLILTKTRTACTLHTLLRKFWIYVLHAN